MSRLEKSIWIARLAACAAIVAFWGDEWIKILVWMLLFDGGFELAIFIRRFERNR